MTSCEPALPAPDVTNPPGQSALRYRPSPHAAALARMRAALGGVESPAPVRVLATHPIDDPAVALLDAWALVCDTVSFYQERIADEGFLRTATELRSVRELARMLGYELRPGVAAETDLAFTVDPAGGPEVTVAAGTPVQTIPPQDKLPQVFETGTELLARREWNAVPAAPTVPQHIAFRGTQLWLGGVGLGLSPGDAVLVVGAERLEFPNRPVSRKQYDDERWDFRVVVAVDEDPDGRSGWTRLTVRPRIGFQAGLELVAERDVRVYAFRQRANLFGWNAPDPTLLRTPDDTTPPTTADGEWTNFELPMPDDAEILEIDGDLPRLLPGSWLVLERPGYRELYRAEAVAPDGAHKFGLSGRITRVRVDYTENLGRFGRRTSLVHCVSEELPAGSRPRTEPVAGNVLDLLPTDPPLPPGRLVVVSGAIDGTATVATERAVVRSCAVAGGVMTVTLDRELTHAYDPATVTVLGNVVPATHGETVSQVLGSGDGRTSFPQFRLRRTPLTYVRANNPQGATAALEIRVDDVAWQEVPSLDVAGPADRAYVVRHADDGAVRVVLGDGRHGARPATGLENVTAAYRVGIGADGAADTGAVSLLTRRPLGIRDVTNPAPARDWAPPEQLEEARVNAPMRVRTLDRAVSVADHADFARGYAGVGRARADLLWDGRARRVAVTVLGVDGAAVGDDLLTGLRAALDAARDPAVTLELPRGETVWFGVRVEIRHDPAYRRAAVEEAVAAALTERFGSGRLDFTEAVAAAAVLVVVRQVPGVLACTMPRLFALPDPPGSPPALPPDSAGVALLTAGPARWRGQAARPAQVLALAPGAVATGVMA
jgi:predicted phage baseplate assembly protein